MKAITKTQPGTEATIRKLANQVEKVLGIHAETFIRWLGYEGYVMRDENGREVQDVKLPALLWDFPKRNQCLLLENAQAKCPVALPRFRTPVDSFGWCHEHGVDVVLCASEKTLRYVNWELREATQNTIA